MNLTPRQLKNFWAKVNKLGAVHPILKTRCWLWTASTSEGGYGRFTVGKRTIVAHKVSYMLGNTIPEGMQLDHLCRTRPCIRSDHLEPVTPSVNTQRGLSGDLKELKLYCLKGHKFTNESTYIQRSSTNKIMRSCRICRRERSKVRNYETRKRGYAVA